MLKPYSRKLTLIVAIVGTMTLALRPQDGSLYITTMVGLITGLYLWLTFKPK